jgi:hypothetical protein
MDGEFEDLIARAQGVDDDQEAPKRGTKTLAYLCKSSLPVKGNKY